VSVRTQRRAWMSRAAVVAAVTAAGLFGAAAPAFAADPQLTDITVEPGTIEPGQQTNVRFKVTNPDNNPRTITVQVASSDNKVSCASTCTFTNASFGPNGTPTGSKDFNVRFAANGSIQQDMQVTLTISAKDGGSGPEVQQQLNINAPDVQQPPTVPEVSGTVSNAATGKGVPAAKVYLQDSVHPTPYEVGTNKDGKFTFTSKPDAPIAPGTIALTRMFFTPSSRDSTRVSPPIAAFAVV